MNKEVQAFKRQRAELGRAIRNGDAVRVGELIAYGATPGRNQLELAIRRAMDNNGKSPVRLNIAERLIKSIGDNSEMTERANRYVECTLITLGAHGNPARQSLMKTMDIVPGETAGIHYGNYTARNRHLAFRPG